MFQKENKQIKSNYSNISITAYRAIKILKLLIEAPRSALELKEALKKDIITNKSVSDDTLRITLNSLKASGCIIARPSLANNYHYVLVSHPFNIDITKEQIKILLNIRKYFLKRNEWQKVIDINNLYSKIASVTNNPENRDLLIYKKPFSKIKPQILEILRYKNLENKVILFRYNSSPKKSEIINVRSQFVFCEAGRLYIMGWYYKRQTYAYFNAEKIMEIHSIEEIPKSEIKEEAYEYVLYKLTGDSCKIFSCSFDDKVVYQDKNYILVESIINSEFKILQKLLSFGSDFELIKPDFLKQKLADKLSKIYSRYE